jgi:hypothetical protein
MVRECVDVEEDGCEEYLAGVSGFEETGASVEDCPWRISCG